MVDSITFTGGQPTGSVTEDTGTVGDNPNTPGIEVGAYLTSSGSIEFNDSDTGPGIFHVPYVTSIGTNLGTVTVNIFNDATGGADLGYVDWNYAVDNTLVQYLAAGETRIESFDILIVGYDGEEQHRTLSITLTGTNDGPSIISGPANVSLSEDDPTASSASFSLFDVDTLDTHTASVTVAVSGTGVVSGSTPSNAALAAMLSTSVNSTTTSQSGTINFTFTPESPAFQYLQAGEQLVISYTITIDDGHGGTASQNVDVTINGTNDIPTITADSSSGGIVEIGTGVAGNATVTGSASDGGANWVDLDHGQDSATLIASASGSGGAGTFATGSFTIQGTYGVLVLHALGAYTYTLNNSDVDTQALDSGQSVADVFDYTITNFGGGSASGTITINIAGSNDAPVLSGVVSPAIFDENALSPSTQNPAANGSFVVTDVDASDLLTPTAAAAVVRINGNIVTSGFPASLANALAITPGIQTSGSGTPRTFLWDYAPGSVDLDFLSATDTLTITYAITASDGTDASNTQNLVITITGTNDTPIISIEPGDSAAGAATETNAGLIVSDTLTITDVDLNDVVTASASFGGSIGNLGGLTAAQLGAMFSVTAGDLTAPGTNSGTLTWTFNSGSAAFNHLAQGETLTIQYVIEVLDGNGGGQLQQIDVVITGSNDAPASAGVYDQDGVAIVVTSSTGNNSIATAVNVDGSFNLSNDANVLDATFRPHTTINATGSALAQFYAFTVSDAGTVGRFDIDNLSGSGNASSPTDSVLYLYDSNGNLLAYNDDQGRTAGVTTNAGELTDAGSTVNPTEGISLESLLTFVFNTPGTYYISVARFAGTAFTPAQQMQGLGAGNTYTLNISLDHGLSNDTGQALVESNAVLDTGGRVDFFDVDSNHSDHNDGDPINNVVASYNFATDAVVVGNGITLTTTQQNDIVNAFVMNNVFGEWSFSLNSPDYLAAGESVTATFTIHGTDPLGGTSSRDVVITIAGTNDAPVILTGAAAANRTEDASLVVSTTVLFNDADISDTHSASVSVIASGTGNNPGLQLNNAQLLALLSTTVTSTTTSANGSVSATFSGNNADFQYLQNGQTLVLEYTVTVDDGHGGTDSETFTINITGSNDGPVAAADVNGPDLVIEAGIDPSGVSTPGDNGTGFFSVFDNDTDADYNDTRTIQGVAAGTLGGPITGSVGSNVTGVYGTLTITSNGFAYYNLNNADTDTNGLAVGQVVTDVFSYTVVDSQGATSTTTVTVTITGTNDAPSILVADGIGALTEDQSTPHITDFGSISFDDVDLTDAHTASVVADPGNTLGGVLFTTIMAPATGSGTGSLIWNYGVPNLFVQYLGAGQTVTENFTITISDGNGGTVIQAVAVTITGTNDAPVITVGGIDTASLTEAAGLASTTVNASGSFAVTDVDANNTLTISEGATSVVWSGGTVPPGVEAALTAAAAFTIADSNASATAVQLDWALNAGALDLNFLGEGETLTVTVPVTITDGIAPVVQNVVVTITGTNDAPIITNGGDSATIGEIAGLTGPGATSPATVTGNFDVADADANGSITLTSSFQGFVSNYGPRTTLTSGQQTALAAGLTFSPLVGNDGTVTWTYQVSNSVIDFLVEAEILTATLLVTADDGNGGTTTTTVAITINGRNDQVFQSGVLNITGNWSEDAAASPPITGTIGYSDADFSNHGLQVTNLSGNLNGGGGLPLGVLTASNAANPALDDGQGEVVWSYTLAPGAADYLAAGEAATETFRVRIIDTAGAPLDHVVTITITGANDAPVISSSADSASFTEDGVLTDSGTFLFNDADISDVHSASHSVTASGNTAGLTLSNAQLNALFTTSVTSTSAVTNGSIDWSFAGSNAAFQYLAVGETLTLTYDVTVSDGNGGTDSESVTVTITGSNDAPVISAVNFNPLPSGTVYVSAGDSFTSIGSALAINGPWSLDFNPEIENSTTVPHMTFIVTGDGTAEYFSFTAPNHSYLNTTAGALWFDVDSPVGTDPFLTLLLNGGPFFTNDNASQVAPFDVSPGNPLDPRAGIQGNGNGAVITLIVGSAASGGTLGLGASYVLHVSNPAYAGPVATGGPGDALTESNAALTTSGNVVFSDPDFTDTPTAAYDSGTGFSASVANGSQLTPAQLASLASAFSITPQGAFTFSVASPDYLSAGQVVTLNYTVTVSDGHGGTDSEVVTLTITGTNDAPVVGNVLNFNVTEGGGTTVVDALTGASDVDGDRLIVVPGTLPAGVTYVGGTGRVITFETNQGYSLGTVVGQGGWIDGTPTSPDNAIVDLGGNQVLRLANDPASGDFAGPYAPSLSISAGETATGAAANTFEFSFSFRPVSGVADGSRIEIDAANSSGTDRYNFMALEFTNGGQGLRLIHNTPNLDGSFDSNDFAYGTGNLLLAANIDPSRWHEIRVVVQFIDGPDNDVISYYLDGVLVGTGTTFENFQDFVGGVGNHDANVDPVDRILFRAGEAGGNPFPADGPGGNRAGFYIDNLGYHAYSDDDHFAFDANNPAYDYLGAGETTVVTVNYGVSDGFTTTPDSLTFTVTGTNDDVTISVADGLGSANEDATSPDLSDSGTITFDDIDLIDTHSVSVTGAVGNTLGGALVATVTDAATGVGDGTVTWTYTVANSATQYLGQGDTATETFTVTISDGNGSTDSVDVVVTITGTNDAAIIGGVATGSVTEDVAVIAGNLTTGGTLTVNDLDQGESSFIAQASTVGTYGIFTLSTAGVWTYTASNSASAIQTLPAGQVLTENFTVASEDGTTSLVTVTITGTNDVPTIGAATAAGTVTEDGGIQIVSGDASIGGANWTDIDNLEDAGLAITLGSAGAAGQTALVFDGNGPGALLGEATITGTYGTLYLQANGLYRYVLNNASSAVQSLDSDETPTDVFNYTISDGSGGTATQTITATVQGANDTASIVVTNPADVSESDTSAIVSFTVADQVTITDVDTQDAANAQDYVAGSGSISTLSGLAPPTGTILGLVSFNAATGAISYDRNAFNWLDDGQSVTYTVNFNAQSGDDGQVAQTLSFTVTGANDAPVTVSDTLTLVENVGATVAVLGNDSDPDNADNITLSGIAVQSVTGLGTLTGPELAALTSNFAIVGNSIVFTPGAGLPGGLETVYDRLNPGDTATIVIVYQASDGTTTTPGTFTLTLTGAAETYVGTPLDDNPFLGSSYDDTMYGQAGDDNISGNGGDDVLYGEGDDDVISGGSGDDTLIGGSGDDILSGGSDTDTAVFANNWAAYTITTGPTPGSFLLYGPGGEIDEISSVELVVFNGTGPFAVNTILNDGPTTSNAAFSVDENVAGPFVIGTVIASDVDAPLGDILSYAITGGNGGGLFAIDSATGAVRIAGTALDRELTGSHTLTVTVTDLHGATATSTVTVTVNDLNDNAPVFTSGTTASVNENAAISTVIYDANSTDADGVGGPTTYSLSGADSAFFNINATTGEVRLNASADYESRASYSINVVANDGANSTTQAVTVSVTDLNDNNPVFQSGNTATVAENAATSTVVYDADATDADASFGPISYSLGGADAALFNIDANTGEVRLNASADYEARTSYAISVVATQGSTSTTQTVSVSVTDLNDNNPVFQSGTTGSVAENAAVSTVVYDANATDADVSFGPITYSLGGADAAFFNIDANTGEVRLNVSADFEVRSSYAISVIATQGATATTQAVTVSVTDLNDNAPVFTSGATASVNENAVTSTVVYDANTTDVDTVGGPATYSLAGADAAFFSINTTTGEVRLLASADFEVRASYSFSVIANDGANSTTQAVTLTVSDLNDNAPIFTSGATGGVNENAATTTVVYDANSTDVDTVGGPTTYSLSGADAALFNIDANTGEVRLNASADYEARSSYSINVIANDGVNSSTQAVTINVTDLNDNNPVFQSGTTATVAENVAAGTLVYTAAATDADATFGPISYSLGGADAAAFAINATTGEVTLVGSPDYEAQTSYSISVTATQGTTATTQAVTVNVTDLNDNNPIFQSGNMATVAENVAAGTLVYTAAATDADATFGPVSYSLGGADAAAFAINATTGEVTLVGSPDFEAQTSYSISVTATQGTTATTQAVTINVTDLNDNNPVFQSGTTATVAENVAAGTLVYTAAATDADASFGPISYSLGGADAAAFAINSTTGEVTLVGSPDYETLSGYSISVTATQGTTATTQAVTINVTDLNDNNPVFQSGATGTVAENAAASTVVYDASATDADASFGPISYSLGGTDAAFFNIDANTGEVRLNASADYEVRSSYDIIVTATQGTTATQQAVTINITDTNDNAPVFFSGGTASVNENAATSTVVYDANTSDADTVGGPVTYSLSGADAAFFNIDANTGEVRLNASANYEARTSYSIDVVANDGANSTTQAVTISVNDLNDNNPVFQSGAVSSVNENVAAGTLVYTAAASDADVNFGPVTYSLSGPDAAAFAINADTGEVTLLASPDHETQASYDINVTATQGTSATTQAVTIFVDDLNDNNPVFQSGTTATVAENAPTTTVVYDANATDADLTLGPVVYSLGGADAALFSIDANTGEVRLLASANYEVRNSYAITVTATQGATTTTQAVTVGVTDLNEFAIGAVTVTGGAANEISATGQVVGNASATDADGTATVTYSLVDNAGGRFAINATTGVITVVNGLLLDFEQNPTHVVTVRATSSDGSFSDGNATITVNNVDPEIVAGTGAAETIYGGAQTDSIILNGGNDVASGGGGDDALDGGDGDDMLIGGDGNDTLEGGLGVDYLIGGIGADLLSGGSGAGNTLQGGTDDDIYIVASAGDSILEFAGEGTDEVRTALTVHTLQANVENLRYTGAASFLGIGNNIDNVLIGGAATDDLYGRDGNDRLMGGAGVANTLLGGLGDDVYVIEAMGDSTVELAGEGIDTVETALTIQSLQNNVENLTFTTNASHFGVGNELGNVMRGGTGADDLYGRAGNDTLRGGTGAANTLLGQEGDDLYIVEAAGDTVIEFAGEGIDTVETALSSFVLRPNVENLTYTGAGNFTGIGSDDANTIRSGAGTDFLDGGNGNDILIGGSGADLMVGGAGADQFRYEGGETGFDRILDFTSGTDRISLSTTGFVHTATINLVQGSGPQAATDGNSTFLYNQATGQLSYDADGNGAGTAVVLAVLNPGLTLGLGDFIFN